MLPATVLKPAFNVTRASHMAFTVKDLDRSLEFYTEVGGLVLTERDENVSYLRGVEEDCHHSLVLRKTDGKPACEQIGFRVLTDDDLDAAEEFFQSAGLDPQWADVPFQRKTLRVRSPQGLPLEFCASMPIQERQHSFVNRQRGGAAMRFDHTQCAVASVQDACDFFASFGFMVSDCSTTPDGDLWSAFMRRKNNPHDIVLGTRPGPRLHHFAYITERENLLRAGDAARSLGYRENVEFGPSRHGQDHNRFIYFRDPDGHRFELTDHPIQLIDLDSVPISRDVTNRDLFAPWGQAAPLSYHEEATEFPGEPVLPTVLKRTW